MHCGTILRGNGLLHFRNVLQCAWTATWIRGIPSQKHTVAGYSESMVVDHIISIYIYIYIGQCKRPLSF